MRLAKGRAAAIIGIVWIKLNGISFGYLPPFSGSTQSVRIVAMKDEGASIAVC